LLRPGPGPADEEARVISPGVCDLGPVKLHYLQAGVGDLVLCLHGFPDHAPSLRTMLESLAAAGLRAVAPFMRGYSPSTTEARTFESAALAGDVLGLGGALASGADLMIVGHDWGAIAAMHAAVLQPDRVRRLVTIGAPHPATMARALREDPEQQRRSWYQFLFLATGFAEKVVADRDFAFLERLIRDWSPRPPFAPEEWYAVRRTLASRGTLTAALRYYRSAFGQEPRDPVLARDAARWSEPVRVPTLAIYGDRDGCIDPEVHAAQAEHFLGDFRLMRVSGAGHWPHLEDPRRVLPEIVGFLRR
jgi:pimeloyl-ACP methyl ester carboxylesterase